MINPKLKYSTRVAILDYSHHPIIQATDMVDLIYKSHSNKCKFQACHMTPQEGIWIWMPDAFTVFTLEVIKNIINVRGQNNILLFTASIKELDKIIKNKEFKRTKQKTQKHY